MRIMRVGAHITRMGGYQFTRVRAHHARGSGSVCVIWVSAARVLTRGYEPDCKGTVGEADGQSAHAGQDVGWQWCVEVDGILE